MVFVYVALGAGLGGVCRYLGMSLITRWAGDRFPWGTLLVNLSGSFLLGAMLGSETWVAASGGDFGQLKALAGIGFCGGLTTFSTFSLQNMGLLSAGARGKLALNIAVSVGGCVLAVASGYLLMKGWAG